MASSIQRTPMALDGPLFKFVLFQTQLDEFYLFACCHHIAIDGLGMALVSRRVATIYSAIVAGAPIPAAYFASAQDLVDLESEYEASSIIWKIRRIGAATFRPKADRLIVCLTPRVSGICTRLLGRSSWIPPSLAGSKSCPKGWASADFRSSPRRARFWSVAGPVAARRWRSTSRSAGEYVRSQRRFPGCSPGLCRWC